MIQLDDLTRNNMLEAIELAWRGQTLLDGVITGTASNPKLGVFTGTKPAAMSTPATGTQLVDMTLPANALANVAAGVKALAGTWQATASAAGAAGYYQVTDGSGAVRERGTAGVQVQVPTTAATAAGGNVLTFAATTGIVVGVNVKGTGIVEPCVVLSLTGTTVTLSVASVAGVASGASITFAPDLVLNSASTEVGQTVTITAKTLTAPNP